MSFEYSEKSAQLQRRLQAFMEQNVYPAEDIFTHQIATAENRFSMLPLLADLRQKARAEGLWNLFVPEGHAEHSAHGGLGNLDYFPLAETMGRVLWSAEVFNCNAPDSGNMEALMKYASAGQKAEWLEPLLAGDIRSCYAMTEPRVASSDATNIECSMKLEDGEWVIDGRKWFVTGAMHERTRIIIVMGKSDPENPDRHRQQTQILVPMDTPGVSVVRPLTTLGYDDAPTGHAEIVFDRVRVPERNVLLGPGRGFEIAQGRLGPGRMHHCMRLLGAAQRALEITCERVKTRSTFGRLLAQHQSVREDIARSFSEIEMARLLVQKTCRRMDEVGAREARDLIAACKTSVPSMVQQIVDRCMQMHGAAGLSGDFFLAEAFNYARWCRQADGPDQVHLMALGKQVIERFGGQADG